MSDFNDVSYITGRGRMCRDAILLTLTVAFLTALAFQIKTNNLIDTREHDACMWRHRVSEESAHRQFVLRRFLETAATTRMKLAGTDTSSRAHAINWHTSRYWRYRLLPMIHTLPEPAPCH